MKVLLAYLYFDSFDRKEIQNFFPSMLILSKLAKAAEGHAGHRHTGKASDD
jgi:hypothetical protein